jgi:hypothetical protein
MITQRENVHEIFKRQKLQPVPRLDSATPHHPEGNLANLFQFDDFVLELSKNSKDNDRKKKLVFHRCRQVPDSTVGYFFTTPHSLSILSIRSQHYHL